MSQQATYELDYALARLRDAVNLTEAEGEGFEAIRKWINEVEEAAKAERVGIVLSTWSALKETSNV